MGNETLEGILNIQAVELDEIVAIKGRPTLATTPELWLIVDGRQ